MLALDASAALGACGHEQGFALFRDEELVAPPLLWSEARSVLHESVWRGETPRAQALLALEALESGPLQPRTHPRLGEEAWRLADQLGWAKTYDAEYVALALLLGVRLVTEDARLWRRLEHLEIVVRPAEL